jgi:hypothetical protein
LWCSWSGNHTWDNLAIYHTFTIAFTHSFLPFTAHSPQQLQLINNLSFWAPTSSKLFGWVQLEIIVIDCRE